MKALSVKQPWAWLIVNGYKDVENRIWPLPKTFEVPQRIYIHASKTWDILSQDTIADVARRLLINYDVAEDWLVNQLRPQSRGVIVGEVLVVGEYSIDRPRGMYGALNEPQWYHGPPYYGFALRDHEAYKEPIPYKGRLGFFKVELPCRT